jgi:hypothetical protein
VWEQFDGKWFPSFCRHIGFLPYCTASSTILYDTK